MKNRTKLLLALGAVTILVLLAYIMYKNAKVDYNKVLRKGSAGKEVLVFQERLNTLDPNKETAVYKSGYFTQSTEDKLNAFLGIKESSINNLSLEAQKKLVRDNQLATVEAPEDEIPTSTF